MVRSKRLAKAAGSLKLIGLFSVLSIATAVSANAGIVASYSVVMDHVGAVGPSASTGCFGLIASAGVGTLTLFDAAGGGGLSLGFGPGATVDTQTCAAALSGAVVSQVVGTYTGVLTGSICTAVPPGLPSFVCNGPPPGTNPIDKAVVAFVAADLFRITDQFPSLAGDPYPIPAGVYGTDSSGGSFDLFLRVTSTSVPEPASLSLIGGGLLVFAGLLRRRKNVSQD